MSHSVIISLSNTSHSPKEVTFVQGLLHDLAARHIDTFIDEPATLADGMNRQAITTQWLVLVLTPEAIRSAQVRALVKTAFDSVKRGQMRGVVAVTFLSDQIEPDDLPDLWDTIRIYYISESFEDQRLAFNKIACLAGPLTPVRTTSSAVNDWTSSSTSQNLASHNQVNSRALPAARSKPAQKSYSRLMIPVSIFTLVLGLILGTFATHAFDQNHFTFPLFTVTSKPTPTSTNKPSHTPSPTPSHVNPNKPAQAPVTNGQLKTALANIDSNQQKFYDLITQKPPTTTINSPMNMQDGLQVNTPDGCTPTNGQYQISVNTPASPTVMCLAQGPSFTNFVYQARMTIHNNNAGGLIFRSDGTQNYSRLSLESNGHYALYDCLANCSSPAIENGKKDGKKVGDGNLSGGEQSIVGQSKLLTIIVHNNTIYFYVDGTHVNHWKDNNYVGTGKTIGLFAALASSSESFTQVTFSDVKVWNITPLS